MEVHKGLRAYMVTQPNAWANVPDHDILKPSSHRCWLVYSASSCYSLIDYSLLILYLDTWTWLSYFPLFAVKWFGCFIATTLRVITKFCCKPFAWTIHLAISSYTKGLNSCFHLTITWGLLLVPTSFTCQGVNLQWQPQPADGSNFQSFTISSLLCCWAWTSSAEETLWSRTAKIS